MSPGIQPSIHNPDVGRPGEKFLVSDGVGAALVQLAGPHPDGGDGAPVPG